MRALPLLLLAGCVHVDWESFREGTARPVVDAPRLKTGASTMKDALELLGPPSLALRAGHVDRFYYVSWDAAFGKLEISVPIPAASRSLSLDAFILSLGAEDLRLARLDFDRDGVLRVLAIGDFGSSNNGQSFALDSRVVSNFLLDRSRSQVVRENDDDEEDVELDAPKK